MLIGKCRKRIADFHLCVHILYFLFWGQTNQKLGTLKNGGVVAFSQNWPIKFHFSVFVYSRNKMCNQPTTWDFGLLRDICIFPNLNKARPFSHFIRTLPCFTNFKLHTNSMFLFFATLFSLFSFVRINCCRTQKQKLQHDIPIPKVISVGAPTRIVPNTFSFTATIYLKNENSFRKDGRRDRATRMSFLLTFGRNEEN